MPRTKTKKPAWQKLTWFEPRSCWKKYRQGQTYYLGECGVNKTRESHAAAMKEWNQKLAELEQAESKDEVAAIIRRHGPFASDVAAIKRIHADPEVRDIGGVISDSYIRRVLDEAKFLGVADHPDAQLPPELVARTRKGTISQIADDYLAMVRAKFDRGERGGGRYDARARDIEQFRAWVSPGHDQPVGNLPADALNARLLASWHQHLSAQVVAGNSTENYGHDRLGTVKTLTRWAWEHEYIDKLPRNIRSRDLAITVRPQEVTTMDTAMVHALLDAASPRTRALMLLMLNTGMTQKDLADLRPEEYKAGGITRKRSKAQSAGTNAPTVTWKLWPATREAIKPFTHETGDHLLTTEQNGPLVTENPKADGHGTSKTDAVRQGYDRLRRKIENRHKREHPNAQPITIPSVKAFRATSANFLRQSDDYADIAELFLGHTAAKVIDRHYAKARQGKLDEAVAWLGKHLGFA